MRKSLKKSIFEFKIHRVYLAIVLLSTILYIVFSYILEIDTEGVDIVGFALSVFVVVGIIIFFTLKRKMEKRFVLVGIIIAFVVWFISALLTPIPSAQAINGANEDFRNLSNETLFAPIRVSDTQDQATFLDAVEIAELVEGRIVGFIEFANAYQIEVPAATPEELTIKIQVIRNLNHPLVEGVFRNYVFDIK